MTTPLVLTAPDSRQPAGYLLLRQRHSIACLPHHVESYVTHGTRQTHSTPTQTDETYPRSYWPGNTDFDHIFVRLCLQDNGTLSKAKRQHPDYAMLGEKEIAGLEAAVTEAFALKAKK